MRLTVRDETWPIAGDFRIARGAKSIAHVVVVEIEDKDMVGRGECVPYDCYGESVDGVIAQIRTFAGQIDALTIQSLQSALPPGAARNALDCALWDLKAKRETAEVWQLAGLPRPTPMCTCFTVSLDEPTKMAEAARNAAHWPVLKVKLGRDGVRERLAAVKDGAPKADIVVDANEAWDMKLLEALLAAPPDGVVLVEQPLPAAEDAMLAGLRPPIPLCADESIHDAVSLSGLVDKYQAVNIKLDKTGGLTEAIATARQAQTMGLRIMVGCMVGTSLGMAPALMLSPFAQWADLDGPLLLARDRTPPLPYEDGMVFPPSRVLWG